MGKKYMDEARDFFSEFMRGKTTIESEDGTEERKTGFPIKSLMLLNGSTTPDNFREYTSEWMLLRGGFSDMHTFGRSCQALESFRGGDEEVLSGT
jgi:hypothetical protein